MNLSDSDSVIPIAVTRPARGSHGRLGRQSSPIAIPSSPSEAAGPCLAGEPPSSSEPAPRPARARKRVLSITSPSGGPPSVQPPRKRKRQSEAVSPSVQLTRPPPSSAAREPQRITPCTPHVLGSPKGEPGRGLLSSSMKPYGPPIRTAGAPNDEPSPPEHPATTSPARSNVSKQPPSPHPVADLAFPTHADPQRDIRSAITSVDEMPLAYSASPQTIADARPGAKNTSNPPSPPPPAALAKDAPASQQGINPKDSPMSQLADVVRPDTISSPYAVSLEQSSRPLRTPVTRATVMSPAARPVGPDVDGRRSTSSQSAPVSPPAVKLPAFASNNPVIAGSPPPPSPQPVAPGPPAPRSSLESDVCTPSTDFNKRSFLACPLSPSPGPSSPTIVRASTYMREGSVAPCASDGLTAIHLARYSRDLRTVPVSDGQSPPAPLSQGRNDTIRSSSTDYLPSSGAEWAHLAE